MKKEIIVTLMLWQLLFSLAHIESAFAGTLIIDGTSSIQTTVEGDQVKVHGSYEIQNRGDEDAKHVFPSLTIGSAQWAGEPQQLGPQVKYQWTVEFSLAKSDLPCHDAQVCNGLALPELGVYPVLVARHYEDTAGRRFTAASIEKITVGDLSWANVAATRAPSVHMKVEVEGDGQEFEASVTLRNLSENSLSGIIAVHTSQELEAIVEARQFRLLPRASVDVPLRVKNFNGLPGSVYAAFPYAQWEEKGIRNLIFSSFRVPIQERVKSDKLVVSIVTVVAISALLLLAFVGYGPGRETRPKHSVSRKEKSAAESNIEP